MQDLFGFVIRYKIITLQKQRVNQKKSRQKSRKEKQERAQEKKMAIKDLINDEEAYFLNLTCIMQRSIMLAKCTSNEAISF